MTTGDDLELHDVSMPGEVDRLLAAYVQAGALAGELRAALAGHGLTADVVAVQPGLCESGEPVVRVVLAGVAAGRLTALLTTGRDRGPPRRDVPTHPPQRCGGPGRLTCRLRPRRLASSAGDGAVYVPEPVRPTPARPGRAAPARAGRRVGRRRR